MSHRRTNGQFAPGNPGGPGNPHAKRIAKLKSALMKAVTPEDVKAVAAALLKKAKAGDVAAASLLLDRIFGKPDRSVDVTLSGRGPLDGLSLDELRERAERLGIRSPPSGDLDDESIGGPYRLPHETNGDG